MSGVPPPVPHAGVGEVALFLDVDGTLLHFADAPGDVTIETETIELLARAYRATGGALALVTGRGLADVDRLFDPLELPAAGQHGFERRDATGVVHRHATPSPLLRVIRLRLEAFRREEPGVLVEDKGLTLAVHYRLAPQAEGRLAALLDGALAGSGDVLCLQRAKMAFEVRSAGKDKGTAIAEFMAEPPFRGRRPVFLGDDLTDEYGFGFVNDVGGVSIKVGDGPTVAPWRLAGVEAVRAWLAGLVREGGH